MKDPICLCNLLACVSLQVVIRQVSAVRCPSVLGDLRREFFFATPAQVRDVLAAHAGNLLEYTEQPEATQYFQSRNNRPTNAITGPAT
jgi:hypothetical protein